MNLLQIIFLALLGLSAGMIVAGGVFSFIVELGVISDFADRTHTGNHILIYEDMVAAGAILGNLFQIFEVNLPGRMIFLAIYGLFGGIFVGQVKPSTAPPIQPDSLVLPLKSLLPTPLRLMQVDLPLPPCRMMPLIPMPELMVNLSAITTSVIVVLPL